jgi:hypothetical protein
VGRAVNDYRLKTLPGQLLHGGINVCAELDPDLHFAQNTPQHPHDFVVGAQQ